MVTTISPGCVSAAGVPQASLLKLFTDTQSPTGTKSVELNLLSQLIKPKEYQFIVNNYDDLCFHDIRQACLKYLDFKVSVRVKFVSLEGEFVLQHRDIKKKHKNQQSRDIKSHNIKA